MKVLYSSLKQYIPELTASAREVADVLTLIGYMSDRFEEVVYLGKPDSLISLEVRQNRADCFSVLGIARELAAYYRIPFVGPSLHTPSWGTTSLPIQVNANDVVRSVRAVHIDGMTQASTPLWMKEFLSLYGMNSVNLFVDISNYVMLLTGYPSHLIDTQRLNGELVWEKNTIFNTIETLDGTSYALSTDNQYLLIHDQKSPVALAGVVGARYAEIHNETTSVIVEMAVYDPAVVRDNMRSLHIMTEAGIRLGKELDPVGMSDAFLLLIGLLQEYGGGTIRSGLFSYDQPRSITPTIIFDPALVSSIAGIAITEDESHSILTALGFDVDNHKDQWSVTVPSFRTDISYAEDLAEEIIRMIGYDRIPIEEVPALAITPDITPMRIEWATVLHGMLVAQGYDEIRSLPLVSSQLNTSVRYRDELPVVTQNAVNEEYPELRQSVITGMLLQKEQYEKRNVAPIKIFEYGTCFGNVGGDYKEHLSLAFAIIPSKGSPLEVFHDDMMSLLTRMGLRATMRPAQIVPPCANPYACWDIVVAGTEVGICFVINDTSYPDAVMAEIDIDTTLSLIDSEGSSSVAELTTKLVTLDVNVERADDAVMNAYMQSLHTTIGSSLWSLKITDRYPLEHTIRYTLRVTYRELSDIDAKQLHNKTFELNA